MDKLNAVVLAGGDDKAFISLGERYMVEYIVAALQEAEYIGDIAIVGDIDRLNSLFGSEVTYYIRGGDNLFSSIEKGIEPFKTDRHVIIITSDIPLIRADIIDEFIAECQWGSADLYYPIIEKSINDMQFPGIKRTYVKLKEGRFTGGNLIYLNPAILNRCKDFAREVLENRKTPWKIGKMLGYRFLFQLLCGRMTIPLIEQRLYDLLSVEGRAIISSHGEIANDLDKTCDIEIISKFL